MEALGWLRAIVARVVPVAGAGRAPEAAGEALWLGRRRAGGREAVRGWPPDGAGGVGARGQVGEALRGSYGARRSSRK